MIDHTIADDLLSIFRRFVSADEPQLHVLALWAMHTHAIGTCVFTPYLLITSAEKGSGKTRTLEVLHSLVRQPRMTASISPAALAHIVDTSMPTLLIDEFDAVMKGNKEFAEAMRGILNGGFKANGTYTRMVGVGAAQKPRDMKTFCCKAISGIGHAPDTIASRAIIIRLKRVPRGQCEAFCPDGKGEASKALQTQLENLRKRAERWAKANTNAIANAQPVVPESFQDRQRDISEPLLAIADLLGEKWPERARAALTVIFDSPISHDTSKRTQLLSDIRQVFTDEETDRLPSADLIRKLCEIETSPWSEWSFGRPITSHQLSKLLKEFEIVPRNIRFGSGTVMKGYTRELFQDAWSRYLGDTQ